MVVCAIYTHQKKGDHIVCSNKVEFEPIMVTVLPSVFVFWIFRSSAHWSSISSTLPFIEMSGRICKGTTTIKLVWLQGTGELRE